MSIGKTCAKYWNISPPSSKAEKPEKQSAHPISARGAFDITFERGIDGLPIVNLPHAIVHHSPDGFEWGYGGSGPSELALNMLSAMIGQEAAQEGGLYQKFKWDFIAHMPEEGGTIKAADIERWLNENGVQTKK